MARTRPLAGITAILTRPAGRNASLARAARLRGASVVVLPGSSLRGPDDATEAKRQLMEALRAHVAIFTSPAAVAFAQRLTRLRTAASTTVLAIGPGTARALRRCGIAATVPEQRYDSEGVLALPALQKLRGRRVALIGAPGGRDALRARLAARGARIVHAHVYRRAAPRWKAAQLAALAAARSPCVLLLSSAEALEALRGQLPAAVWKRLAREPVVASSERIAQAARAAGLRRVERAASALARDLLDAAGRVR